MKIQYEKGSGRDSDTLTIKEAFESEVSWKSTGIVEDARGKAEEASERIGRLCEVLQQKGLLSAHEILTVAGVYHNDCRFVDE